MKLFIGYDEQGPYTLDEIRAFGDKEFIDFLYFVCEDSYYKGHEDGYKKAQEDIDECEELMKNYGKGIYQSALEALHKNIDKETADNDKQEFIKVDDAFNSTHQNLDADSSLITEHMNGELD